MDHAEGDRKINEGKEVILQKEWQKNWKSAVTAAAGKRSTVDTMSVLIIALRCCEVESID